MALGGLTATGGEREAQPCPDGTHALRSTAGTGGAEGFFLLKALV